MTRAFMIFVCLIICCKSFANDENPYDGVWAISRKDCGEISGPHNQTIIKENRFDQYEAQCAVDRKLVIEGGWQLYMTCDSEGEKFKEVAEISIINDGISIRKKGEYSKNSEKQNYISCLTKNKFKNNVTLSKFSEKYEICIADSNGNTEKMLDCDSQERRRKDAKLNELYQNIMSLLSSEQKVVLRDAQRAWIKYRETSCSAIRIIEGRRTMSLTLVSACDLDILADRVQWLEKLSKL